MGIDREVTDLIVMTGIREELERKLNNLSTEQLNSVRQFVDSLEPQPPQENLEYPVTNEDIDRVIESYRQQNKPLPIGLAKGEFTVPDDFNEPLDYKSNRINFSSSETLKYQSGK